MRLRATAARRILFLVKALPKPEHVPIRITDFKHLHLDPVDPFNVARRASAGAHGCLRREYIVCLKKQDGRSWAAGRLGRPVTGPKSFFSETDSSRSQDCVGTVGLHLQLELQDIAVESDASIDIGDSHAAHHRTCDLFCPTSVNVCLHGTPTGE